jgi:hypothetical protein
MRILTIIHLAKLRKSNESYWDWSKGWQSRLGINGCGDGLGD